MTRNVSLFLICVSATCVIFFSLFFAYHPRLNLILHYVAVFTVLSALIFLGEYAKILLATTVVVMLGQPLLADYLNLDFHSLQPNLRLTLKLGTGIVRGLDDEIHLTTDSKGFRTTAADAYDRRFKIFAVGGSTTEQIYLDDDKTTFALLERALGSEYAVINTGVSGLRAVHHIATMKEIGKYRPHAVVILLGINDWNCAVIAACEHARSSLDPRGWPTTLGWRRLQTYLSNEFMAKKSPAAPLPAPPPNPNASPLDYYAQVMGQYASKRKFELGDAAAYLTVFKLDFARLLATSQSMATTCIIVTQPTGYKADNFRDADYVHSLWMTPPDQAGAFSEQSLINLATTFNDYIRTHARCSNCKLLDLATLLNGDTRYLYDDAHFNNAGARFFADELLAFLRREGLAPMQTQ